jgi:hypothetical protein
VENLSTYLYFQVPALMHLFKAKYIGTMQHHNFVTSATCITTALHSMSVNYA